MGARAEADLLVARNVKRCAIYIRVSTAEQRMEGWSLEAQEAGLRAEAKKKGWKVVGVYADEGKSARKRLKERKAIHQLMADVKAGLVDVILFKELDRWFRSISDFYKIQDVLDVCGVEWFSQQQPTLEMRTKEGRLQVNVLLSVGQNETDAGSDRLKYTFKYLRQQKRWTSSASTLPRCYTLDDDQHVIKNPEWEAYTRALLDRILRTGSMRGALVETNEEFGREFQYRNARGMITNPMLCGEYKEVPDFVEDPYLTREEFDRIMQMVTNNARHGGRYFYIFSGMVRCGTCGRRMIGNAVTKKNGREYRYYRCSQANLSKICPDAKRINEEALEAYLLDKVKAVVDEKIATVKEVRQQRKRKPRKSNKAAIDKKLDKLEDLYINDDRMTKEKYEKKKAAIMAQLIEDEAEAPLPELAGLEKIQGIFDSGITAIYADFTPEEKREFWRGILDQVVVKDGQVYEADEHGGLYFLE